MRKTTTMIETTPTLYKKIEIADNHIDYSEMYRTQETLQLNKRLRKTRNVILIAAAIMITGGLVLLMMPESPFTLTNLFSYMVVAAFMLILSFYSNKHPFFTVVAALVACIGFWGFEILTNSMSDLLVETSIHKLFIVSLLVWRFHLSREAELIRKELYFS